MQYVVERADQEIGVFRSEYERRTNFQGIRMFAGGAAQHLALAQRVDNTRRFTRSGGFTCSIKNEFHANKKARSAYIANHCMTILQREQFRAQIRTDPLRVVDQLLVAHDIEYCKSRSR